MNGDKPDNAGYRTNFPPCSKFAGDRGLRL